MFYVRSFLVSLRTFCRIFFLIIFCLLDNLCFLWSEWCVSHLIFCISQFSSKVCQCHEWEIKWPMRMAGMVSLTVCLSASPWHCSGHWEAAYKLGHKAVWVVSTVVRNKFQSSEPPSRSKPSKQVALGKQAFSFSKINHENEISK